MNGSSLEAILIGDSVAIRRLRAQIAQFGPTRLPALIQGPTGSGKELVARALHLASRRDGAFVAFNVCALSDTMFEDAIFGHVKGAFTGATGDRLGYLAEANGGTVFFDEIGGTAAAAQSKLLRALETGTFRAVGAATDRISDFRVVAATNEALDVLARHGRFRQDLLHRLAGVTLNVPPLRSRPDDIAPLARYFVAAMQFRDGAALTARALQRLEEWDWPGNVRELKHTVERAAVLADGDEVDAEHVTQAIDGLAGALAYAAADRESVERLALLRALMESEWDTAVAAQMLGVHRATVYRRMRLYGLDARQFEAGGIRTDSQAFARTSANVRIDAGGTPKEMLSGQ